MYRSIIILAICFRNFAISAVLPINKDATILNYDYQNDGRGNYHFSYVASNGIKRNETGQLVNAGQKNEHIAVKGFYAFTDPSGKNWIYQYSADEDGYSVSDQSAQKTVSIKSEEDINIPDYAAPGVSPQILSSLLGR